jgi:hypothetical protein
VAVRAKADMEHNGNGFGSDGRKMDMLGQAQLVYESNWETIWKAILKRTKRTVHDHSMFAIWTKEFSHVG